MDDAQRGFVFRYSVLNDHWGQPLWLALLTLVYISSVSVVRLVHVSVFGGDHRLPLAVITASAVLIIPVSMLVQWRATARYHHIAEERNNARELAQPPNAPGCLVTETFADEPVKPLASQSTQQLDYLNLVITLLAIFKYSILSPCQHTSDHTPIRNAVSWFFTPWVMQGMVLCLGAASRPQLSTQRVHMTLSITAGAILMQVSKSANPPPPGASIPTRQHTHPERREYTLALTTTAHSQACYLLLLRLVIFPQREADVTDGGCLYQVMQYAQAEFVQDSSSHTPLPLTDMLSDLFSPFWHLWILYAHVLWQLIAPYWSHLRWGVTAAVVLATLNGFLVRAYQSPLRAVNYLPFFMAGVGLRNQALLAPALHYMTTPAARVWSAAMLAGHAVVAAVAAHHHMPLEYFTLISDYRQFSGETLSSQRECVQAWTSGS